MRAREFIFEAAYDGMITAAKNKYSDQPELQIVNQEIDAEVIWAKNNLKKSDRITWYLRIYFAYLDDSVSGKDVKLPPLLGGYQLNDWNEFKNQLLHYFGYPSPKIQNFQFVKQPVNIVFDEFRQFEQEYLSQTGHPVNPKTGDRVLIPFADGSAWWWVDRAYCSDEGRSGQHCGNVVGKHKTDQRILSYRIKNQVQLTFILEPDGSLGEMKAKGNRKPDSKLHPVIMPLLLSDTVKGISGMGYLPEMNFSIFDLNERDLKIIQENKSKLISDQLAISPREALSAPKWILSNPENRRVVLEKGFGIGKLINDQGEISTRNEDWEKVIAQDWRNASLILYAPESLKNYEDRLLMYLSDNPKDFLKIRASYRKDSEFVKEAVRRDAYIFEYVNPNMRNYEEVAMVAIAIAPWVIRNVPEEKRTFDMCKVAVDNPKFYQDRNLFNYYPAGQYSYIPDKFLTKELCLTAINHDSTSIERVPEQLLTPEFYREAIALNGNVIFRTPDKLRTPELLLLAIKHGAAHVLDGADIMTPEFYQKAVEANGNALGYVPREYQTPEMFYEALKQGKYALKDVPSELRTLRICLAAIKHSARSWEYIPSNLKTSNFILAAIKLNHAILEYIPQENRTHNICLIAVKKNGLRLRSVPGPLRDHDMCWAAVKQTGTAITYVPSYNLTPEDYKALCVAAVENDPGAIAYLYSDNFTSKEFHKLCLSAVERDPQVLLNIPVDFRTLDVGIAAVKQDKSLLGYLSDDLQEVIQKKLGIDIF